MAQHRLRRRGRQAQIRLGGVFYNTSISDWYYKFDDLTLSESDKHHFTPLGDGATTPDEDWQLHAGFSYFESAVLAYEPVNGEPRIFATHHIYPDSNPSGAGSPTGQYVVQWYVIDPDLDDFLTTNWEPTLEAVGRLDPVPETNDDDACDPVIAVTPQGVAYIEYTLSSPDIWPQIRRAELTGDYTAVEDDTVIQEGPDDVAYEEIEDYSIWQDYADIQEDPDGCGTLSLHILVYDPNQETNPSVEQRSVWLLENAIGCNEAEMTGDGIIDEKDLYLFNDYYALGDLRADKNRDFKVDFLDYAIYTDEYAKRPK